MKKYLALASFGSLGVFGLVLAIYFVIGKMRFYDSEFSGRIINITHTSDFKPNLVLDNGMSFPLGRYEKEIEIGDSVFKEKDEREIKIVITDSAGRRKIIRKTY